MISADAIRGYVDLMVLAILRDHPSYAYHLSQTIANITEDTYVIKQTTLYSALKRLEGAGLVESYPGTSNSGKPRTYYRITSLGTDHLGLKLEEWETTKSVVDRFAKGIR